MTKLNMYKIANIAYHVIYYFLLYHFSVRPTEQRWFKIAGQSAFVTVFIFTPGVRIPQLNYVYLPDLIFSTILV